MFCRGNNYLRNLLGALKNKTSTIMHVIKLVYLGFLKALDKALHGISLCYGLLKDTRAQRLYLFKGSKQQSRTQNVLS